MRGLEHFRELAASDAADLLVNFRRLVVLALLAEILHPHFDLTLIFVVHPPLFKVIRVREQVDAS